MLIDLAIHELAPMGDGVHQSEHGRIYVDRALPGDSVQAKLLPASAGIVRAELTQVVTASSHRVKPPCAHYDVCGGCTLQHASDEFYRDWKVHVVHTALDKRGLKPSLWRAPIFLPESKRRRVTFAAYKKRNAVTLGYFRRRSHQVAEITSCLVAEPLIMALRAKLAMALAPILQEGKAADVFIQTVDGAIEIVITGPVGKKGGPDLHVREAAAQMAQVLRVNRISWRRRERDAPDVMLEVNPLYAKFGALDVALPPLAFLQPTKAGEDTLVSAVMGLLPQGGKFADLFCGCGTFSGPMLARGAVDAFDSTAPAIRALEKARGSNPINPAQRDLFREPLSPEELNRYAAVVFDPPRAGAEAQARALAASKVPYVIAVSCNPATFARDARILADGGYDFKSITVVDQFTWSHHVELVAAFVRRT